MRKHAEKETLKNNEYCATGSQSEHASSSENVIQLSFTDYRIKREMSESPSTRAPSAQAWQQYIFTLQFALIDAILIPHSSGLSFLNDITKHIKAMTLT